MTSSGIPLVEVYRPKNLENIVLDPLNKQILKNIIETCYFPNLLFTKQRKKHGLILCFRSFKLLNTGHFR